MSNFTPSRYDNIIIYACTNINANIGNLCKVIRPHVYAGCYISTLIHPTLHHALWITWDIKFYGEWCDFHTIFNTYTTCCETVHIDPKPYVTSVHNKVEMLWWERQPNSWHPMKRYLWKEEDFSWIRYCTRQLQSRVSVTRVICVDYIFGVLVWHSCVFFTNSGDCFMVQLAWRLLWSEAKLFMIIFHLDMSILRWIQSKIFHFNKMNKKWA